MACFSTNLILFKKLQWKIVRDMLAHIWRSLGAKIERSPNGACGDPKGGAGLALQNWIPNMRSKMPEMKFKWGCVVLLLSKNDAVGHSLNNVGKTDADSADYAVAETSEGWKHKTLICILIVEWWNRSWALHDRVWIEQEWKTVLLPLNALI